VGAIELGLDGAGRRQRNVAKGRTKSVVPAKMRESRQRIDAGLVVKEDDRRRDYLRWWQETVLRGTAKVSTQVSYEQVLRDYVIPVVGGIPVLKLSPVDVRTMLGRSTSAVCRPVSSATPGRCCGGRSRWR
jgi:hypothetical protein